MNDTELLAALADEAARVGAVPVADLGATVPWCGEWQVRDVVGHLAGVQRWATLLIDNPGSWTRRRDMEPPPPGDAVLAWYQAGVEPMRAALDGPDLDVVVSTWAGDRPRRWWLRRLVHETSVHRWDVEAGARGPTDAGPIEGAVAVDGIDELFENFAPLAAESLRGDGETIHLHATDCVGEWLVRFASDGLVVEHAHAKGDVAVRAAAADLLLLLWNRRSVDDGGFEVFGDREVLGRWHQRARF